MQPPGERPAPSAAPRAGFWLYAGHLWAVFAIAVSNILLGLTVLAAPWGARPFSAPWQRWRSLLMPLGLYVLGLLLSIAVSYEPRFSVRAMTEIFSLTTLVLALLLVRGEDRVRRIVNGLIVLSALLALSGLVQYLWDFGGINNRIRGPFSHYMTFSGVLLLADLMLGAQLVASPAARRSIWRWAALVLLNLALLGSLTRSAWMGVLVGFTLLLLLRAPKLIVAYIPAALLFVLLVSRVVGFPRAVDRQTLGSLELRPPLHGEGRPDDDRRAAALRPGPGAGEAALSDLS